MLFRLELAFSNGDEAKGMGNEVNVESLKFKGTENGEADIQAFTPYTLHPTPTDVSNLSPLTFNLKSDWTSLLDMLRLLGLHSYWLSDEYHEIAQREIDNVDMRQQYEFLVKLYHQPRWVQRLKQRLLRIAAKPIDLLKRLKQKKKPAQTNIIINNKEYRKSMGL
jgi:hypothetical protein